MKKPYYNPKTNETYIKCSNGNITIRAIIGSVGFEGNFWVERNIFGGITKRERSQYYGIITEDRNASS